MAKKSKVQSGGVNIKRSKVHVGGDIVGRDKITQSSDLSQVEQQFDRIYQLIDQRRIDPDIDKDEIRNTVTRIEKEVKKGDEANPQKVERWLRFLAGMADDIFQVTAATLSNPVAGIAKTIQLIAKRATQENS